MTTARVPQEVIDMIIGYLTDKRTLKLCSRVCQSWVEPSQRELFKSFKLRCARRNDDLVFSRFVSFSQRHPKPCKHIQHLWILNHMEIDYEVVLSLVQRLPGLSSVCIKGGLFTSRNPTQLPPIPDPPCQLKHLHFLIVGNANYHSGMNAVIGILALFSVVECVVIHTYLWPSSAPNETSAESTLLKSIQQQIIVHDLSLKFVPARISKIVAATELRRLSIQIHDLESVLSYGEVLAEALALEFLEFEIQRKVMADLDAVDWLQKEVLHLPECQNLKAVHVILPIHRDPTFDYHAYFELLLDVLSWLPAKSLRDFCFHVIGNYDVSSHADIPLASWFNWQRLETILLKIPVLRKVHFDIRNDMGKAYPTQIFRLFHALIYDNLPPFIATNVLRITNPEPCVYLM